MSKKINRVVLGIGKFSPDYYWLTLTRPERRRVSFIPGETHFVTSDQQLYFRKPRILKLQGKKVRLVAEVLG